MIAIYIFAFLWWMTSDFAGAITAYRVWAKGDMPVAGKILYAPKLIIFAALDVVLNYTLFMLLGVPPKHCYTISARLEHYNNNDAKPKQKWVARFMCEQLLNPLDVLSPTKRHC